MVQKMVPPPSEYLPWAKRPATEKSADDLPTSDIDIAGIQCSHIIPGTQRIGGDVRTKRRNNKCERYEECTSSIVPVIDELERVPENLAVKSDARACCRDADEAGQCETNRDYYELDILTEI